MENALKRRLLAGEQLYGVWLSSASGNVAELLGWAGYDFAIIDHEHGQGSLGDGVHMMRACAMANCPVIVRVPWNDQVYLKRILDAGAQSIMVPMVEIGRGGRRRRLRLPLPARRAPRLCPHRRCAAGAPLWLYNRLSLSRQRRAAADHPDRERQGRGRRRRDRRRRRRRHGVHRHQRHGRLDRPARQLDNPDVRALAAQAEAGIRRSGKLSGTVPSSGAGTVELFGKGYNLVAGAGDMPMLREAAKADLANVRAGMAKLGKGR